MFFAGILHTLTQIPKDLYNAGVEDCMHAISIPIGMNSKYGTPIKLEQLSTLKNSITRKLNNYFPGEDFSSKLEYLYDASFWANPKTIKLYFNGYSVKTGNSVNFLVALTKTITSEKILFEYETVLVPYKFDKSFACLTTINEVNGKIDEVKCSMADSKITKEMIACVAASIAPEYFSMTFPFSEASTKYVDYIKAHLSKYLSLVKYLKADEVKDAIKKFEEKKRVDFDAIVQQVKDKCFVQPPEEGEDGDEDGDLKKLVDETKKLQDLFEEMMRRPRKNTHKRQRRHHYHVRG